MWLSSLAFAALLAHASTTDSILADGSHCVAYRAEKVSFLVSSDSVVGKNCDISAQVLPEVGGLYHIEVIVPIRSFQSGDTGRDEDVMKTLKADVKPEMTFKSKAMTADQWHALFAKTEFELEGELSIGDRTFPLKVPLRYKEHADNAEVDGVAKVRFQDFAISPPRVGGGLVAKTKPDLELHFHLLASRILGADSIRLSKPASAAAGEDVKLDDNTKPEAKIPEKKDSEVKEPVKQ